MGQEIRSIFHVKIAYSLSLSDILLLSGYLIPRLTIVPRQNPSNKQKNNTLPCMSRLNLAWKLSYLFWTGWLPRVTERTRWGQREIGWSGRFLYWWTYHSTRTCPRRSERRGCSAAGRFWAWDNKPRYRGWVRKRLCEGEDVIFQGILQANWIDING